MINLLPIALAMLIKFELNFAPQRWLGCDILIFPPAMTSLLALLKLADPTSLRKYNIRRKLIFKPQLNV